MRNLLELFIRNGGFVTFVLVEVFCFALIGAMILVIIKYRLNVTLGDMCNNTHLR